MKKTGLKIAVSILMAMCMFCSVLTACSFTGEADKDGTQYPGGNVPLTDLASTYKGQATDENGNLLAPFDVVYPEAFEGGEYQYDQTAALLKMGKSFDGKITKDLRSCGFTSLEKVTVTADGSVWYRAALNAGTDVKTAVKKARSLKAVLIADFDYIYEDNSTEVTNDETSASSDASGLIDEVLNNLQVKDQWYLTACDIQKSWRWLKNKGISAGGDPSVTVAVIDTGVDYTHPDLKANMWVNPDEIPGNGIDDDGDGYIDDVYGCSTVSDERFHSGDPMDDHGHGTHVAGIIAAANNKIGTVGVAYNVKIMAIKAGQATGVFLQSDIAEAIVYAYTHGADVINMSFGGSACSIAVQDALQSAYTTSTLVAAAGNDGKPNEPTDYYPSLPSYPAALSYVVGVMSVSALGVESSFTNWDVTAFNSVEYEVYAPGEAMLSTLPNNRYGKLNGTSMATPVVSGIAALLRSYYTDRDMYPSKFISAQLCATSEDTPYCFDPEYHVINGCLHNLPMIVNAYAALTKLPKPDVNLYGYYLFDSETISESNNGDGVIDAGETINIGAILRNRWGMSKDTMVKIDAMSDLGVANPYVEILTDTVYFEGVGTYSTKDNLTRAENGAYRGAEDPFVVKIDKDCPNDYVINLNVTVTFGNGLDDSDTVIYENPGIISFAVRNGVVLPSQITEDMTLTKDNYYIIPNSTVIKEGVTVTVDPGTKIQFWSNDPEDPYADQYIAYLQVEGNFITNGTLEEPVELFPSELMDRYVVEIEEVNKGRVELSYTNVTNASIDISVADHCKFTQSYAGYLYKRYVKDGAVVNETCYYGASISHTGSYIAFKVQDAKNCIMYALGGAYNEYSNPVFLGSYFTCSFIDSTFKTAYFGSDAADFTDCVFMGNRNVMEGAYINLSSISMRNVSAVNVSLSEQIKCDQTTYVSVYFYNGTGSYDDKYLSEVREFAKYIGGDICCVETEDEWNMIVNSDYGRIIGQIGLVAGKNKWVNGEPVAEFMKKLLENMVSDYPNIDDGKILFCCSKDADKKIQMSFQRDGYFNFVLELPSTTEWTTDLLTAKYKEYLKSTGYGLFSNVKNCAILNNYSEENFALKIIAPENGDQKLYYNENGIANNYWGTTDIDLINKQVVDYDMFKNYIDLIVDPILTTAPENTFPFVTDAYVVNSNGERARKVSNETCTFVVEFNRDMDTSVPLRLRFGSSAPYAEYEITGSFVTPRRWEGVYTLKTTIENGNQYFNIENGRAADDHFLRLYETKGRFGFEIDTTLAQAMIMQGEATETGVKLTWQQDDFDTLLGYNVYRSDKEDGFYTRLNDYVLAANENEFFDATVEPGKLYYYNFTVVKTDMQESTPQRQNRYPRDGYHGSEYLSFSCPHGIHGAEADYFRNDHR